MLLDDSEVCCSLLTLTERETLTHGEAASVVAALSYVQWIAWLGGSGLKFKTSLSSCSLKCASLVLCSCTPEDEAL